MSGCMAGLRRIFRRGKSEPPRATGQISSQKTKKDKKGSNSLQDLSEKNRQNVNANINSINPENVDTDDENNMNEQTISRIRSQTKSQASKKEVQIVDPDDTINSHPKTTTSIIKSRHEYESSESSSRGHEDEIQKTDSRYQPQRMDANLSSKKSLKSSSKDDDQRSTNSKDDTSYQISTNYIKKVESQTYRNIEEQQNRAFNSLQPTGDINASDKFVDIVDSMIDINNAIIPSQFQNAPLIQSTFLTNQQQQLLLQQNAVVNGKIQNTVDTESTTIVSLRNENRELLISNKNLHEYVESLKKQINDKDIEINKLQEALTKEFKTESEKEILKELMTSRTENKNMLDTQNQLIESLKVRNKQLQDELDRFQANYPDANAHFAQVKALKNEISQLQKVTHILNIQLSSYQATYPSQNLKNKKDRMLTGFPTEGPIPTWMVDTKFLSPLIAAYDERLNEKDIKLVELGKKIEKLAEKMKVITNENEELHAKLEQVPHHLITDKNQGSSKLSEWELIKRHAQIVLEENQVLREQVDLYRTKLLESQNQFIQEKGRLSKRIVLLEADKVDLSNRVDSAKGNYEELQHKYNDLSIEIERRVKLQEHMNQIGDLKRKIEEIVMTHKQEMENTLLLLQTVQAEKKEITIKMTDLTAQNKRIMAENEVLEKALQEGIGRKMQKKIQSLQKRLELAEIKEKTAYLCLAKITKEAEKIKLEKDTYENLAKTHEEENMKIENKIAEENLKVARLEEKLHSYKEKASTKLAKTLHRVQSKDTELMLHKIETDKKISDMLNLLQKKQDQIDEFIKEKRQLEADLETVWQTTTTENRKLKETLLDLKSSTNVEKHSSIHFLLKDSDYEDN